MNPKRIEWHEEDDELVTPWIDGRRIERYRDARGDWRWRVVHRNGNILATSGGDGYRRRGDCLRSLRGVAHMFICGHP